MNYSYESYRNYTSSTCIVDNIDSNVPPATSAVPFEPTIDVFEFKINNKYGNGMVWMSYLVTMNGDSKRTAVKMLKLKMW